MDVVFTWAGTYSLERELTPKPVAELTAGDLFIKGGFPGHAVLVADAVENRATGERRFLLLQSFMPAQDIHVLKNRPIADGSPWYPLDFGDRLVTRSGPSRARAFAPGARRIATTSLGRVRWLLPPQARAAVHGQRHAGDEVRFVGGQEQRGVGHVPGGAHLAAQRHAASRVAATSARVLPQVRARVSTAIGVSIRPGRMTLQRMPNSAFWVAICSV